MKKLILIPLVLLGLKFTPNLVVKAGLISYYLYNNSLEAQTPLTKEDADTYYKPVSYIPALSTIQIDGTPYISVDGQYNAENSVYTWNMIQSKPDFMGIAYNALSSQLIEDSPLVHFEVQELAISGNSLSIKTGTVVINTIELPPSISSETQSLSITGLNISIKSGATTINTIAIPNQTTNLSAVAFSGDYGSLSGTPSIPAAQVNSDWNSGSGSSQILNKPTLGTAASQNSSAFATAAQGALAISALQSEVDASITNEIELPSQTSNSGKYLTTNGTSPNWTTLLSQVTQTLIGSNGITISTASNSFTISNTKRQETYSGTTDGSGNYTISFSTAYSTTPNIQAALINGTDSQNLRITSRTTTGFTVLIRNRTDALGLLPSWSNVSGAEVDVLVTEK